MKANTKPSVEDVKQLYEDCERRYQESGVFEEFEQDEKFYECDIHDLLDLPKELRVLSANDKGGIVVPTARYFIDTAVDHTNVFFPVVKVPSKETGFNSRTFDEAEMIRKAALGIYYGNNIDNSIAPARVGCKHFYINGVAIFKEGWDPDRYMNRPDRGQDESENDYAVKMDEWRSTHHDSVPVFYQAIHPGHIMLDPYHDGGMFVFETRDELVFDVNEKFPWWGNPEGKQKLSDKVKHVTFFSNQWRGEFYDWEPVMPLKGKKGIFNHDYGFIPYTVIDTGLGNVSKDNDLKQRYVGLLRYVRDLLISESRDYSLGDILLKRGVLGGGFLQGDDAKLVEKIDEGYGKWTPLPPGVEVVKNQPDTPPEALLQWMETTQNYLAALAPRSVRGMGETGVRSAAHQRSLADQAAQMYQYSNIAFENGFSKVLSNCVRIVKNVVPGDIDLWARTPTDEFDVEIKKDKLKEPFVVYVQFNSMSDEENYRKQDGLRLLVQSGIASIDYARAQMPNMDVKAMKKAELKQVIRTGLVPQYQQYANARLTIALSELAAKEGIPQTLGMPQQQGQGGPPQGMNPATGGNGMPQPGMPPQAPPGRNMITQIPERSMPGAQQDVENYLKGLRSPVPVHPGQGETGGGFRK